VTQNKDKARLTEAILIFQIFLAFHCNQLISHGVTIFLFGIHVFLVQVFVTAGELRLGWRHVMMLCSSAR
jgi:hypothetical protein